MHNENMFTQAHADSLSLRGIIISHVVGLMNNVGFIIQGGEMVKGDVDKWEFLKGTELVYSTFSSDSVLTQVVLDSHKECKLRNRIMSSNCDHGDLHTQIWFHFM